MCSIAGRYPARPTGQAGEAPPREWIDRVHAMVMAMRHRGPDEQHTEAYDDVVLGHGRLKIRDLSPLAKQPMTTPDGRYVLVFNGELYNHHEFRAELGAKGVEFRSTGDTEVLLHALVHYGDDLLARLNGEFAFAFLDRETGRMLLARDIYGIKPLSYVAGDDAFWFASEPKALLEPAGPAARVADEYSVVRYFTEGFLDVGHHTFYRDVKALPACHKMVVQDGRVVAVEPYRAYPHDTPIERNVEQTLKRAVERRLDADVRVGASLSGGLDSGTLVTLVGEVYGPGFPTFTAATDDPRLDETPLAEQTAKAARAAPTFVPCSSPTPGELVDLVEEQGAPVEMFTEFAKRRMVRAARDAGVIVLLEGTGSDEVFGGYPHLQSARLADLLASRRLVQFVNEYRTAQPQRRREFLYFLLPRSVRNVLRRLAHRRVRRYLQPEVAARNPLAPPYQFSRTRSRVKEALAEHLTYRGLPGLLRYADRFTMAASVEGRYAYLDPDVVSAVFALPDDDIVAEGRTKRALRRIAGGRVPADILKNPTKSNFDVPERKWIQGNLKDIFRESLTDGRLEARGWLKPGTGRELYENFQQGKDLRLAIRVFMLETWARIFLDGDGAPADGSHG